MVSDRINNAAVFYDFTPKNNNSTEKYAYSICFADKHLELRVAAPKNEPINDEKTLHWLTEVFFPKLFNWAMNDKGAKTSISSLSHVCVKKYCHLYSLLKEKYAQSLIDVSLNLRERLSNNNVERILIDLHVL